MATEKVGFSDDEIEAIEVQDVAEQEAGFSDDEIDALEAGGDKHPAWRSALAGAEDTALLGYGPNIRSAIKTQSFSSPEYIEERDRINAENKEMQDEDPGSFIAGQFGGGAATLLIPGGGAMKAGGMLARAGKAALAGAAIAGAADTPDVPGQVTDSTSTEDLTERGKNAAMGGALGPVAELGVSAIRNVTPNELNRAFAALLPSKAARRNVRLAEESGGLSTKKNILGFARDEGILDGLPNSQELYQRALESKAKYGEALDTIYRRSQELLGDSMHQKVTPSTLKNHLSMKSMDDIRKQVIQEIRTKKWADADKDSAIQQLTNYFDGLKSEVGEAADLLQLHDIKSSIGSKSFKESRAELPTSTEEFWRTAGRVVDDEIKKRVDMLADVASRSQDKQLGQILREANRRYSLTQDIYTMAADAIDSAGGRIPRDPMDLFGVGLRAPELQVGLSKVGRAAAAIPQALKPSGAQVGTPFQQMINDSTRLPSPNELYRQRVPRPLTNIERAKQINQQRKMMKQQLGE